MIEIIRYTSDLKNEWDVFCRQAKNPLFMFQRDYMDYHKDRFMDHSLMFYYKGKLIALLPANQSEGELHSHGGLTYGGFIVDNKMKQHIMNECFDVLIDYCSNLSLSRILYKTVPHIFHNQPCEEDLYGLYIFGGKAVKYEASTVINLKDPLKMTKGRHAGIQRAKREGVIVKELSSLEDFEYFINIENEFLESRHNVRAVHSGEELKMLRDSFPQNIHLFGGFIDDKMISGAVLFEYEDAVHTQYLAADNKAREIGGLDVVVDYVINLYKDRKKWLDFGISTENNGLFLNEGLISQKESFGGRTAVYSTWELRCYA